MEKRKVVIEINFNNYGITPQRLTKKWIEDRISIFHRFTLKSLKKQTNQNFLTVVKLAGGCSEIVDQALRKYEPLPENIKFGTSIESKRRIETYLKGFDELYIARLDSDDMYHKTFVQQLHDYKAKKTTEVLINQNGYLWDCRQDSMSLIHYPSPQFYTFIYSTKDFLAGTRYQFRSHLNVIKLFSYETMNKNNYVIVLHSSMTSDKRLTKERVAPSAMKKILQDFM